MAEKREVSQAVGAVIPYADITEVFPRIWAVKAYESPLNPYRV